MLKTEMRKIYSRFYAVNGLLLGVLPKLLVCPRTGIGEPMLCWQTAQLETLTAVVFLMAAVMIRFSKQAAKIRVTEPICHMVSFAAAWIGILIPVKIIGGCASPAMMCNIAGYPVIYMISGLTASVALAAMVIPALRKLNTGRRTDISW